MNFLGLQLHDKVAVLAFRGICMTKKKSSVPSGKNAFDVRGAQCVFRESRTAAVQHCIAFEYPFLKFSSTGYFPLLNLKY